MNAIDAPVHALGWALLHFLWQGALVGAVAAALLWQLRDARPQARYAVACVALLACLLLPVATWLGDATPPFAAAATTTGLGDGSPVSATPVADAASARPGAAGTAWRARVAPVLPTVVVLWAIGAALLALRMCAGVAWVARLESRGRPHAFWQAQVDALAERMKLPRRVLLRVVDGIDTPAVARALRPVVLVPATLLARMPAELVEALLAHELAHVRRHDYLVNLLQGAVEALLFYHPVVWWLSRRIRVERELIADDLAAAAIGDRHRIARALVALSELPSRPDSVPTPIPALAADGGPLVSRIRHLVRPRRPSVHWKAAVPVIGISVLCLSFAQARPEIPPAAAAAVPVATASVRPATVALAAAAPAASPGGVLERIHADEPAADASSPKRGTFRSHGTLVDGDDDGRDSYALVGADDDGTVFIDGNRDHIERLRAMRARIDGEFLWVRRDGREYVVDDPALLAQVRRAWDRTQPVAREMEALGAQMEKHGEAMEAIGKRMESQAGLGQDEARAMEKLGGQMSAIGAEQAELAARHARLAHEASFGDDEATRERARVALDALAVDVERVEERMHALSDQMDEYAEAMRRAHAPLEALSAEMERASAPMEALAEEMASFGAQMEALSGEAEAATHRAIEQAARDGKLVPIDRAASL